MKKYILWDFDCTLVYRDGKWSKTLQEVLEKHSITISYDTLHQYMDHGLPWHDYQIPHTELFLNQTWWEYVNHYLANILISLGFNHHEAMNYASEFKDAYLAIDKWHVYEDTIPTLEKLKSMGYTHIIASNHVPELAELCDKLGLISYVDSIYSSANMNFDKPHPGFYQTILNDLHHPKSIVMIGDNYQADVLGAKQVGIKGILVRSENKNNYEYYAKTLVDVENKIKKS